MRFIITTALYLLMTSQIVGQQLIVLNTFDNVQGENNVDALFCSNYVNGSFYMAGTAEIYDANGDEIRALWICKVNANGQVLKKVYFDNDGLYPTVLERLWENDLLCGGYYRGVGGFLIRLDANLNVVQSKVFEGYPINDLFVSSYEKLIVAASYSEIWLFDEDMNVTREIFIDSRYNMASICESADGEIVILGEVSCCPENPDLPDEYFGRGDIMVCEVSMVGNIEWLRLCGGSGTEVAYVNETYGRDCEIIKTTEGNYVFMVETESGDGDVTTEYGSDDVWVVKISGEGELLFQKSLGTKATDAPTAIIELEEHFLVGARMQSFNDGNDEINCDTCNSVISWAGLLNKSNGSLEGQFWLDGDDEEIFTSFSFGGGVLFCTGWSTSREGNFLNKVKDGQDAFIAIYRDLMTSELMVPALEGVSIDVTGKVLVVNNELALAKYLKLYAINGVCVYTSSLVEGRNFVDLEGSLGGQVYIAVVSGNAGSISKEVFIH